MCLLVTYQLFIWDFGQVFVGWPRINWSSGAVAGMNIRLRMAESLMYSDKSNLDTSDLRGAAQTDWYVQSGRPEGEVFEPRFTVSTATQHDDANCRPHTFSLVASSGPLG